MPSPQSEMLSVYDGWYRPGHIIKRGKRGFKAFDANDNRLGTFRSVHEHAQYIGCHLREKGKQGHALGGRGADSTPPSLPTYKPSAERTARTAVCASARGGHS